MAGVLSSQIPAVGDKVPAAISEAHTRSIGPTDAIPEPRVGQAPKLRRGTGAPKHKTCPGCSSSGARNLVVCIDGTSNQFSTKNTNVVELYSRLIKDETQRTFYNSGIGTYAKPSWRSLKYWNQVIDNKLDLAFALRLEKIIISAYAWLVDNYEPGDRIFLFGFSRGAYQVRALAAMINIVGLLHKGNNDQIPFAYELYAASRVKERKIRQPPEAPPTYSPNPPNPADTGHLVSADEVRLPYLRERISILPRRKKQLPVFPKPRQMPVPHAERTRTGPLAMQEQFKSTFSRPVHVHFVGAWDTVSSVGLVRGKTLPATTEGMKFVCFFRHALALHEYRVKFLPEYANGGRGPDPEQPRSGFSGMHTKEVWFTGSHSDIGGGSTANTTLDQFGPALRWMSWEAMLAGLKLDNSPPNWERIGVTTSMSNVWRLIECLPFFKHLSYKDPDEEFRWIWWRRGASEEAIFPRKQPVTWLPHFCANRRIKPRQRIHRSVYEECDEFKQPESVEPEEDAYIDAADILRPQEEVLGSGCVLDEQNTRRLELLAYSAQGIRSLRAVDVLQYIYNMARSCLDSDGKAQILEDLRVLHTAYLDGSFKVDRPEDIDRRHTDDGAYLPSSATFSFHMCGHTNSVSSVAFLSDTVVVSGSRDKTIRIWDVGSGNMTLGSTVSYHSGITCVAVHAEDAPAAVASTSDDSTIRLWTFDSNRVVHAQKILQDEIWNHVIATAFSPDGSHLISGSTDCAIRVWDTATGKRVGSAAHGHTDYVRSVMFSPDGTQIVSGSDDHTVQVWEWSRGEAAVQPFGQPLSGHTDAVYSVAFSPDGRIIASGSADKSVRLWDAFTRMEKFSLDGHTRPVRCVAFGPSGRYLVSGSDDWTMRVWDIGTGVALRVIRAHTDSIRSVAFSPDGTRIASGSDDKTIRVWDFVPDSDESESRRDEVA